MQKNEIKLIKLSLLIILLLITIKVVIFGDIKTLLLYLLFIMLMTIVLCEVLDTTSQKDFTKLEWKKEINTTSIEEKELSIVEKLKTGKIRVFCETKEQHEIIYKIGTEGKIKLITFEEFMKEYQEYQNKGQQELQE